MSTNDKIKELSIQQLAQQCIDVQDACNLSGVAGFLARVTVTLWDQARADGHGTTWVNEHPVCVMLTNKLASLTGQYHGGDERFKVAYDWCIERAAGYAQSWDYRYQEAA
jgi:hypothetical protein